MLSLFIILFLYSLPTWSQDTCIPPSSEKSFDYKHKGIQNLIKLDQNLSPTRDQDSIGDCFAYSAADLYESWLKSKGDLAPHQHISALAISLLNHQDKWTKNTALIFQKINMHRDAVSKIDKLKVELDNLDKKQEKTNQKILQEKYNYKINHPIQVKIDSISKQVRQLLRQGKSTIELDNLLAQLNQQIELNLLQDKGFQRKIASYENQKIFNRKKIQEITQQIDSLKKEIGIFDLIVPRGGNEKDALKITLSEKILCLESEVSSRDDALIDLYKQKYDQLEKFYFKANNLQNALGYLATYYYFDTYAPCSIETTYDEPNSCVASDVVRALFPGSSLQSQNDLNNFFNELALGPYFFKEILVDSCTSKSFKNSPIIEEKYSNGSFDIIPIEKNDHLFELIDQELKSKKIAAISYKSVIFNQDSNFPKEDDKKHSRHSSAIVGKLELCNRTYYILRNSWGKRHCEFKKQNFISTQTSKKQSIPFFCDEDGNFIIEREHLKKGLYGTTYITN